MSGGHAIHPPVQPCRAGCRQGRQDPDDRADGAYKGTVACRYQRRAPSLAAKASRGQTKSIERRAVRRRMI